MGRATSSCTPHACHWNAMKTIARMPKAKPVAWATRLYSVDPDPMMSGVRVWNTASRISQTGVVAAVTRRTFISSAVLDDVSQRSSAPVSAMMPNTTTASVRTRRRV